MCIRDRPIGFFQIEKQILHIRIVQGCAFSVKTDGLYDVLAVGQDVVCDINYKNLSDEEFRWLIRILQKSKKTGTPINQRKKR